MNATLYERLMNPNSNYHLAINTGFPNTFDKAASCQSLTYVKDIVVMVGLRYEDATRNAVTGIERFSGSINHRSIRSHSSKPFRYIPANEKSAVAVVRTGSAAEIDIGKHNVDWVSGIAQRYGVLATSGLDYDVAGFAQTAGDTVSDEKLVLDHKQWAPFATDTDKSAAPKAKRLAPGADR